MKQVNNTIKFVAAGTAASLCAATGAVAEDIDVSGAYVGVGVSSFSGVLGEYAYGVTGPASFTGFAGYNFVNGDMVYGAEVGMSSDTIYESYGGPYGLTGLLDVKARLGKTFGSTFLYGTLGYTQTDYAYYYDVEGTGTGWSIGGGFETEMTDSMFIGVDVTSRTFTDDTSSDDKIMESPITSIEIRTGFRF